MINTTNSHSMPQLLSPGQSRVPIIKMLYALKKNKKQYFSSVTSQNSIIRYEEESDSHTKRENDGPKTKMKSQSSEQLSLRNMVDNWQSRANQQSGKHIQQNIKNGRISDGTQKRNSINRKPNTPKSKDNQQRKEYFLKNNLLIESYNLTNPIRIPKSQQRHTKLEKIKCQPGMQFTVLSAQTTRNSEPQLKGVSFKKTSRAFDWQKLKFHESILPPLKPLTETDEYRKEQKLTMSQLNRKLTIVPGNQDYSKFEIKLAKFDEQDVTKLNQKLFDARNQARQLATSINRISEIHMQRLNKQD